MPKSVTKNNVKELLENLLYELEEVQGELLELRSRERSLQAEIDKLESQLED